MIQKLNNLIIDGSAVKLIFIDATFKANVQAKQVVVFCHGYKGFTVVH
jgi:hypothetical protein